MDKLTHKRAIQVLMYQNRMDNPNASIRYFDRVWVVGGKVYLFDYIAKQAQKPGQLIEEVYDEEARQIYRAKPYWLTQFMNRIGLNK